MALVMTILTVIAMLGGITLLLWVCTVFESRHLGPLVVNGVDNLVVDGPVQPAADPVVAPALRVVEAA